MSDDTNKPVIKFYATWSCLFAQRVWITLHHLNIPYEFIESFALDSVKKETIKDPNLLAINPKGTVPTLDVGGEIVMESISIVEYLHKFSGNESADPNFVTPQLIEDANSVNQKITPNMFGVFKRENAEHREAAWDDFVAGFKSFAEQIQPEGYYKSETMNVVDITIFPLVMRLCYMERFKQKTFDESKKWVKTLYGWRDRMLSHEAVKKTVADKEELLNWFKNKWLMLGVVV